MLRSKTFTVQEQKQGHVGQEDISWRRPGEHGGGSGGGGGRGDPA